MSASLEAGFLRFPLVELVDAGGAEVDDLWAAVAVFFKAHALGAVVSI